MKTLLWMVAGVVLVVVPVVSAKQYVFPAKGQTPEQQAIDEAACKQWAVQQTGFDPSAPAPAAATAAAPATTAPAPEPMKGGAVKGAAIAAGVAKLSDNDASDAAGAGAAAGLVMQRQANRKAAEQQKTQEKAQQDAAKAQQQVSTAEQQAKQVEFDKASAACLTGKGYTVQ